jgi:hypothetical protein
MPVSRRSFLRSGTTAVLATAAALQIAPLAFAHDGAKHDPTRDLEVPGQPGQRSLSDLKRKSFEPYVGSKFRVSAGAHSQEMTLAKVRGSELSARGRKLTKKIRQSDCFILVFSSAGSMTDLTTIYDVEHGALGKFPLFLTRRDKAGGGHFYEAVFNHA